MRSLLPTVLMAAFVVTVPAASSTGAEEPTHSVSVVGDAGQVLTTYPSYEPDISRFGIRSASAVSALSVTAEATDPDASALINGEPATIGAATTVNGLTSGDEINVQITDSSGTSNQSWIITPPGFPLLTGSGIHPDLADGMVFLTLGSFIGSPFTAIVDPNGVPVRATAENNSDLKQSAADSTRYSAAIPATGGGYRIIELDEEWGETRSHQLTGKPASTDFHDSVLLPDGGVVLMGYDVVERNEATYTDAIIEVQDADGVPTLTWNSKDHVDEDTEGLVDRSADDYAHINSLQQLDNGDVLASFRNMSQVMLIAGSDHDGHAKGEVIWRLGGVRNDFDVVDDPYGGPCAQHAATLLDNGHLMIFDNGSRRDTDGPIAPQTADMCPDPADPTGPRVARPQSRVTEYALDFSSTTPTATLVWSHEPTGRYAPFAGNAQRLANGNTLVGWSQSEVPPGTTRPVATEVSPAGDEIWSLSAGGPFSYRAFKYPASDRTPPAVTFTSPADGAIVAQGDGLIARFTCTDTGGSNLATCDGTRAHGADLSTEPGTHTLTVTATDLNGNETTESLTYTVIADALPTTSPAPEPTSSPAPEPSPVLQVGAQPDVTIRKLGGSWKGTNQYEARGQTVTVRTRTPSRFVVRVRIRNRGDAEGRFLIEGSRSAHWAQIRWFAGERDVTSRVASGTYRTGRLAPGVAWRLRMVVEVLDTSHPRRKVIRLRATEGHAEDVVKARLLVP